MTTTISLSELRRWLLLDGLIVRPKPGFLFKITEVQQPMTDKEMAEVGQPGWGRK